MGSAIDRLLEAGLVLIVLAAPLPFGAVGAGGRLGLEVLALSLLVPWTARAFLRRTVWPPKLALAGALGLLALAAVQVLPLGDATVAALSPRTAELRASMRPEGDALVAERALLAADPHALAEPPTLSVDPAATASALRTGAALVALLLVATTVAATRGAGRVALALLISAAFQGLYGFLVLASGYDRIWNVSKRYYLDSATGTFINRNHFAAFVAMGLAVGLALTLRQAARSRESAAARRSFAAWLGGAGSRTLLLGLLLALAAVGLLSSMSRAGIATGLLALLVTALATGRRGRRAPRLAAALAIVAVAAVPLGQLGYDELSERYARSGKDLVRAGSRGTVWSDSIDAAAAFPLTGAGFGTFASIYPVFRSPAVRAFYAHAHNDAIQLAVEGGMTAVGLGLLLLVPLATTMLRALAGAKGTLAVGIAAGLGAVLTHSLVDFNFHIPANAATATILAGMLFGLPWIDRG